MLKLGKSVLTIIPILCLSVFALADYIAVRSPRIIVWGTVLMRPMAVISMPSAQEFIHRARTQALWLRTSAAVTLLRMI
jgi:hypothetical protein